MEWVCIIFRHTHSMNWTEQRELRKGVESRPQVSAGLCFLWRTFERSHDFQNARILMILNHRQNDPKTGRQTVSQSTSFQEKREACSYFIIFYPIFIYFHHGLHISGAFHAPRSLSSRWLAAASLWGARFQQRNKNSCGFDKSWDRMVYICVKYTVYNIVITYTHMNPTHVY